MPPTKIKMRNLRTVVPPDVFAALELAALDHGTTLAAYVRLALTQHVAAFDADTLTHRPLPASVSDDAWHDLKTWAVTSGTTIPAQHRSSRLAVLAWARSIGYDQ